MTNPCSVAGVVNGAVYDFVAFLCKSEHPVVIGGNYPPNKVLTKLDEWMKTRDLTSSQMRQDVFLDALASGRINQDIA